MGFLEEILFTGIIRYTGKIRKTVSTNGGKRIFIETDESVLKKLEKGITSIAINGACHTVEDINAQIFVVFSSFETLKKTALGNLKNGEIVNLELPVTMNSFLDGHLVLGHVDGIGRIVDIDKKGDSYLFRFTTSEEIFSYLVEKDSLAIDGISLTIFDLKANKFEVAIIPETIKKTNLRFKRVGDSVNLEVNIFAKYAKKFYQGREF